MTYITNVPPDVLDEIEHITSALPGKVFYADDGEALILASSGTYIISVEPGRPPFNKGNPTHIVRLPVCQRAGRRLQRIDRCRSCHR